MELGDPVAKQVVEQYCSYLACGLTSIVNIFQPEVLCIGGGICNQGETLLRPVRDFATLDADDAVLLQGVVDCFFEENGELVVVDFKTDRIGRTQIEERAEHYRPQLETYSMALMRVMGKKVREKVLYFFSVGEEKVL